MKALKGHRRSGTRVRMQMKALKGRTLPKQMSRQRELGEGDEGSSLEAMKAEGCSLLMRAPKEPTADR